MVHVFASCHAIAPDDMIWVSWQKKSSGAVTDLSDIIVRNIALPIGLVDIKVCAIDEDWSGLKFAIRTELRAGSGRREFKLSRRGKVRSSAVWRAHRRGNNAIANDRKNLGFDGNDICSGAWRVG